jgi:hypothetical protein
MALLGIVGRFRSSHAGQKSLILLMVMAGLVSVLSAGVMGQPRFRFPLEPLVALGTAFFVSDYLMAWSAKLFRGFSNRGATD